MEASLTTGIVSTLPRSFSKAVELREIDEVMTIAPPGLLDNGM